MISARETARARLTKLSARAQHPWARVGTFLVSNEFAKVKVVPDYAGRCRNLFWIMNHNCVYCVLGSGGSKLGGHLAWPGDMTKLRVVTSHGVRIISQQTGWDCNENFVPAYGKRPLPQNLCGEKVRVHYDCAFIRETGIFCSTTARPTTQWLL